MEDGLCRRLVQVGIRTMTPHLRAQATGSAWRSTAPTVARRARRGARGPLYVSLDLDGLDPAFAPGVAHPEPGGSARARRGSDVCCTASGAHRRRRRGRVQPASRHPRPDGAGGREAASRKLAAVAVRNAGAAPSARGGRLRDQDSTCAIKQAADLTLPASGVAAARGLASRCAGRASARPPRPQFQPHGAAGSAVAPRPPATHAAGMPNGVALVGAESTTVPGALPATMTLRVSSCAGTDCVEHRTASNMPQTRVGRRGGHRG